VPSAVNGASSKPALVAVNGPKLGAHGVRRSNDDAQATLVLAWNVETRERMGALFAALVCCSCSASVHQRIFCLTVVSTALSTSTDGGESWEYYATLDNGTAISPPQSSDCYPTVLQVGESLLTVSYLVLFCAAAVLVLVWSLLAVNPELQQLCGGRQTWSTYDGGPRGAGRAEAAGGAPANIKLARTAVPRRGN
jgi:hypothetical protein